MKPRILLCLIAAGLPALASADKIDVKTGLWETTSTMDMTGIPRMPAIQPETLAKMPPEQRARIEAMTARSITAGSDRKSQSCLTEKELEHGFKPDSSHESSARPSRPKSTAHRRKYI
jgi:hypothetical protein